jgi:hypothetical protein
MLSVSYLRVMLSAVRRRRMKPKHLDNKSLVAPAFEILRLRSALTRFPSLRMTRGVP